uniref:YLP motif-containing protein 1 n=1 Tax=Anopheles atroparvus TaxID=41427 RepID=A0AAG5D3J3_ANOAO
MSWQNNWPPMHQPGLAPAYPPPIAGAPQLPSTDPVPDYGALSADQYKQWQWQQYHMQYAQWHAQYGEQYARETGKSLPPVATPTLQMQPMPPTLATTLYPAAPLPIGPSFTALSMVAPPPPAEPHPDELNLNKGQEKPPLPEEKSNEELAFDEQFRKWEQEFESWKHKNKNHPDKAAYREYEQKCMNCRKKLLERREQLRRKRIEQNAAAQGSSTFAVQHPSYPPQPPDPIPPPPPPGPPPPSQDGERSVARQQDHRENDSPRETSLGLENVFSQSAINGEGTGGIPGLDLIDEHPPPQPKKIKLDDQAEEEGVEVMEVIDLANNEEEVKPQISGVNNTANALSSLLNDPKVNALLQLVGSTIAGSSGNGAGGSNAGLTNPLVAALAQLSNRTASLEVEKLNQNIENRPNGSVERNDEPSTSQAGRGAIEDVGTMRTHLQDFNPRIPPPLLDIDLSRPPPTIHGNKRQQSDRWSANVDQHFSQNGSFISGYSAEGSPLAKVARFDRPPPPFESREIEYQIDPELGRPVAVPKPDWMTEDEYQEIYDRYEHVNSFEERKNKMELAILVLRQSKVRDGRMGPREAPPQQVRGGMPKPLPNVKAEIASEQPDEFFQPQQVFDYTNCRNPLAPAVNHQTPTGRVIDYGHCATGQYNSTNKNNRGNNRRDGFRNIQNSGAGNEFGSNTQRFDYNHSRMANVAPKGSVEEEQRKRWPLENQSVAYDRSVPGLERLAQMHLNPNPEESNPNYPSKFLLMNDNRPSCLSTKRGKRPSSIRKQKLKQQMQQPQMQQLQNSDTPQTVPEPSVPKPIVCKEEPPQDLEDLSSDDDDTVDDTVDGEYSTDDGARRMKQKLQDERPASVLSAQLSQHHSAPRLLDIEDLLFPPGRLTRPPRICLLVRGLPGSGKSYLARTIKTKEQAFGPSPRVLSLDDYFLVDKEEDEKDPVTGKVTKVTRSQYEFDAEMEEIYIQNLLKAFKRTISERLFNFVIVDCCNHRLEYYCEFHNYARSNGFKVYTCTMQTDVDVCARQNIHNRTAVEIQAYADAWAMAPEDHVQINFNGLLQSEQQDTDTTVADMDLADPEEESHAELVRRQSEDAITSHEEGNGDSADSTAEVFYGYTSVVQDIQETGTTGGHFNVMNPLFFFVSEVGQLYFMVAASSQFTERARSIIQYLCP